MARPKDESKIEAIYDATLSLVLKNGFSGLKMADVAKKAKLATGTVYVYFNDKKSLINSLYLHLKRDSTGKYFENIDPDKPFKVNFRTIWFNFFEESFRAPEISAFLEQYYRSPYIHEDVQSEASGLLKPVFEMLEKGKNEMLIKNMNTDILLAQLTGPVYELLRLYNNNVIEITDQVKEQAFLLAWDSVKS